MLSRRLLPACLLGLTMSLAVPHALAQDSELFAIKNRWENITATMREDAQAKAMKSLAGELEALAARYPESAEVFTSLLAVASEEASHKKINLSRFYSQVCDVSRNTILWHHA